MCWTSTSSYLSYPLSYTTMKIFFKKFNSLCRYRSKCETKWNLIKTFKFITSCKAWREFTIASDIKIQKSLALLIWFSLSDVIILQWHEFKMCILQKINLFSTYVKEMSLKCLQKHLSRNLLKRYLYISYEA